MVEGAKKVNAIQSTAIEGPCVSCNGITTRKCGGSCQRFLHHMSTCGVADRNATEETEGYSVKHFCNDCDNALLKVHEFS